MPLVDKVRMLEEETDRFEDPRDLASRVNQVHLLTNLAFQPASGLGTRGVGKSDSNS